MKESLTAPLRSLGLILGAMRYPDPTLCNMTTLPMCELGQLKRLEA